MSLEENAKDVTQERVGLDVDKSLHDLGAPTQLTLTSGREEVTVVPPTGACR